MAEDLPLLHTAQVAAVDTNGAGDTFATAYMLALAGRSRSPGAAANWAASRCHSLAALVASIECLPAKQCLKSAGSWFPDALSSNLAAWHGAEVPWCLACMRARRAVMQGQACKPQCVADLIVRGSSYARYRQWLRTQVRTHGASKGELLVHVPAVTSQAAGSFRWDGVGMMSAV